jgi:hypothetical protein
MFKRLLTSLVFFYCTMPLLATPTDDALAYLALAKAIEAQKHPKVATGPKKKCPCSCGCKGGNACACKDCPCDCGCGPDKKCFCEVFSNPQADDYKDGYNQALASQKGLITVVGGKREDLDRAFPDFVVCRVASFPGVDGPGIVVAKFEDGKLIRLLDTSIDSPVSSLQITSKSLAPANTSGSCASGR